MIAYVVGLWLCCICYSANALINRATLGDSEPSRAESRPLYIAYPQHGSVSSYEVAVGVLAAVKGDEPIVDRVLRESRPTIAPGNMFLRGNVEDRFRERSMEHWPCVVPEESLPNALRTPFEDLSEAFLGFLERSHVLHAHRLSWKDAELSDSSLGWHEVDLWRLERGACRFGQPPCSRLSGAVWMESFLRERGGVVTERVSKLSSRGRRCASREDFRFFVYAPLSGSAEEAAVAWYRSAVGGRDVWGSDVFGAEMSEKDRERAGEPDALFTYAALFDGLWSHPARTENAEEACVLFPMVVDTLCASNMCRRTPSEVTATLASLPHWNGGRDHLVWHFGDHASEFDVGAAMLIKSSVGPPWDRSQMRPEDPESLPQLEPSRPHWDIVPTVLSYRCREDQLTHFNRWQRWAREFPQHVRTRSLDDGKPSFPSPSPSVGTPASSNSSLAYLVQAHSSRNKIAPIGSSSAPIQIVQREPNQEFPFAPHSDILWDGHELQAESPQTTIEAAALKITNTLDSLGSTILGPLASDNGNHQTNPTSSSSSSYSSSHTKSFNNPLYPPLSMNPSPSNFQYPPIAHRTTPGQGRPFLLTFRGTAKGIPGSHPAAGRLNLWRATHNNDDVRIILTCSDISKSCLTGNPERYYTFTKAYGLLGELYDNNIENVCRQWDQQSQLPENSFDNLLLNTDFGAVVSGEGTHSYRIVEVMQAGAIPVFVGPVPAPFNDIIHWSRAAVFARDDSPQALQRLPARLRDIPPHHRAAMHREGQRIYWTVLATMHLQIDATLASIHHRYATVLDGAENLWRTAGLPVYAEAAAAAQSSSAEAWAAAAEASLGLHTALTTTPPNATSSRPNIRIRPGPSLNAKYNRKDCPTPVAAKSSTTTPPPSPIDQSSPRPLLQQVDLHRASAISKTPVRLDSAEIVADRHPAINVASPTHVQLLQSTRVSEIDRPGVLLAKSFSNASDVLGSLSAVAPRIPLPNTDLCRSFFERVEAQLALETYARRRDGEPPVDPNVAQEAYDLLQKGFEAFEKDRAGEALIWVSRAHRILVPDARSIIVRCALDLVFDVLEAELAACAGSMRIATNIYQMALLPSGWIISKYGEANLMERTGIQWTNLIFRMQTVRLLADVVHGSALLKQTLEQGRLPDVAVAGGRPFHSRRVQHTDIYASIAPLPKLSNSDMGLLGIAEQVEGPSTFLPKAPRPIPVSPPKIVIVSMCDYPVDAEISLLTPAGLSNKNRWCRAMGYDCRLETQAPDDSRPPAWSKILVTAKHLWRGDWVVWVDCDTFVTNSSNADVVSILSAAGADLSSSLGFSESPPASSLLVSPCPAGPSPLLVAGEDGTMFNTGWFALRGRCGWSLELLRDAFSGSDAHPSEAEAEMLAMLQPVEYLLEFAAAGERERRQRGKEEGKVLLGLSLDVAGEPVATSPFASFPIWEQAAIVELLSRRPSVAARVAVVPQWVVNSYPIPLAAQLPAAFKSDVVAWHERAALVDRRECARVVSGVGVGEVVVGEMTNACDAKVWAHLFLHHPWLPGDGFVAFPGCRLLLGGAACNEWVDRFSKAADLDFDGHVAKARLAFEELQVDLISVGSAGRAFSESSNGAGSIPVGQ